MAIRLAVRSTPLKYPARPGSSNRRRLFGPPRLAKPGFLALEGRFPAATVRALKARGHEVHVGEDWSEGRLSACAAERTPEGMVLKAGANPRGMQGYAVGR